MTEVLCEVDDLHGIKVRPKACLGQATSGKTDVILTIDSGDPADQLVRYFPSARNPFKVSCNAEMQSSLYEVLGREHIQLIAPPKETRMRSMGGASIGR